MNEELERLVHIMIQKKVLKTSEIIEAFKAIDRKYFVLEEYEKEAREIIKALEEGK